jgi:hypothetical protein
VSDAKIEATNYGYAQYLSLPQGADPKAFELESCWQPSKQNVTYTCDGELQLREYPNTDELSYSNRSASAFCPVAPIGEVAEQFLVGSIRNTSQVWPNGSYVFGEPSPDFMSIIVTHNLSFVMNNIAASLSKFALDNGGETVHGIVEVS